MINSILIAKFKTILCVGFLVLLTAETFPAAAAGKQGESALTTPHAAGDVNSKGISDRKFVMDVYQAALMEIALAKVAVEKVQNPELRKLARDLSQDHQQELSDLRQLARERELAPPTGEFSLPTELNGEQKEELIRFQQLKGAEFEKTYMDYVLRKHQESVKKLEEAVQTVHSDKLHQFTLQRWPMLQHHLRSAREVQEEMNPAAVGGSDSARKGAGERNEEIQTDSSLNQDQIQSRDSRTDRK